MRHWQLRLVYWIRFTKSQTSSSPQAAATQKLCRQKKPKQCVSWFKKKRGGGVSFISHHTHTPMVKHYHPTQKVCSLPSWHWVCKLPGGAVRRPHTERLCMGLGCGFASRLRAAYYMEECAGLSGKPANRMLCTWDVPDAPQKKQERKSRHWLKCSGIIK